MHKLNNYNRLSVVIAPYSNEIYWCSRDGFRTVIKLNPTQQANQN